jgi:hypothetical protein
MSNIQQTGVNNDRPSKKIIFLAAFSFWLLGYSISLLALLLADGFLHRLKRKKIFHRFFRML